MRSLSLAKSAALCDPGFNPLPILLRPAQILSNDWGPPQVYYGQLRTVGKRHHAALRALAFKWQRILFRCWKQGVMYDESKYIGSLKKRNSPLGMWRAE
jgi:hypothetical protein